MDSLQYLLSTELGMFGEMQSTLYGFGKFRLVTLFLKPPKHAVSLFSFARLDDQHNKYI